MPNARIRQIAVGVVVIALLFVSGMYVGTRLVPNAWQTTTRHESPRAFIKWYERKSDEINSKLQAQAISRGAVLQMYQQMAPRAADVLPRAIGTKYESRIRHIVLELANATNDTITAEQQLPWLRRSAGSLFERVSFALELARLRERTASDGDTNRLSEALAAADDAIAMITPTLSDNRFLREFQCNPGLVLLSYQVRGQILSRLGQPEDAAYTYEQAAAIMMGLPEAIQRQYEAVGAAELKHHAAVEWLKANDVQRAYQLIVSIDNLAAKRESSSFFAALTARQMPNKYYRDFAWQWMSLQPWDVHTVSMVNEYAMLDAVDGHNDSDSETVHIDRAISLITRVFNEHEDLLAQADQHAAPGMRAEALRQGRTPGVAELHSMRAQLHLNAMDLLWKTSRRSEACLHAHVILQQFPNHIAAESVRALLQ